MSTGNEIKISSLEEFLAKFEELASQKVWHLRWDNYIRSGLENDDWLSAECPICFVANYVETEPHNKYRNLFWHTKFYKANKKDSILIVLAADNGKADLYNEYGITQEQVNGVRQRLLKATGLTSR